MANNGFFMRDAYLSRTAKLSDEELGRLFRACMIYHATGEVVELEGRESIAFDFIREDIDDQARAYEAKCETNRRNRNGTTVNGRQQSSTVVNETRPDPTAVRNIKVKEKENVNISILESSSEISAHEEADDEEAFRIQQEHDQILQAAENAGFPRNNTVRAKLLDAYAQHGKEKVLRAIEQCATHSAASIAYLQAVLSDKPKPDTGQGKPARTVIAQQYSQRDYSGQTESVEDVLARMEHGQRATG